MQIDGSSAIVVGGVGGLGEATVRRLHEAGAKVVIADLPDEKGKALEAELGVRYVRTDAARRHRRQGCDRGLVEHICPNDYLNGEVIRLDGALRFPSR
jgi:NAD(P)-dependent dehydrogenase (short-subunit alcohol dehydrogenase family)